MLPILVFFFDFLRTGSPHKVTFLEDGILNQLPLFRLKFARRFAFSQTERFLPNDMGYPRYKHYRAVLDSLLILTNASLWGKLERGIIATNLMSENGRITTDRITLIYLV